jgi:hypothetical protein
MVLGMSLVFPGRTEQEIQKWAPGTDSIKTVFEEVVEEYGYSGRGEEERVWMWTETPRREGMVRSILGEKLGLVLEMENWGFWINALLDVWFISVSGCGER